MNGLADPVLRRRVAPIPAGMFQLIFLYPFLIIPIEMNDWDEGQEVGCVPGSTNRMSGDTSRKQFYIEFNVLCLNVYDFIGS